MIVKIAVNIFPSSKLALANLKGKVMTSKSPTMKAPINEKIKDGMMARIKKMK